MVNLVAVAMVKNEIDIVEAFARHTLAYANRLIVLDNGSTDGTRELLHRLVAEGLPVTVVEDGSPGKEQARQMTRLMREYAVAQHRPDWVLPLDADEFVAVSGGGPLVDETTSTERPLALPWRGYVPDATDDPAELNPAIRIRQRVADMSPVVKVLIPGRLAARPEASLLQGNHELHMGGKPYDANRHGKAYLGHFPIRSPGQYLAKIVLAVLQYQSTPQRDPFPGWHYRKPFELIKRDPYAFLAGYAADARRYARVSNPTDDSAIITDPFPYRGGALRYTQPADDMARAWQAVVSHAEDLAGRFGLLAHWHSGDGQAAFDRCQTLITGLRTTIDRLVDELQQKEHVIQQMAARQNLPWPVRARRWLAKSLSKFKGAHFKVQSLTR